MKKIVLLLILFLATFARAQNNVIDLSNAGIVALQINQDKSITFVHKGVLDRGIMLYPEKGILQIVTLNPGEDHPNMIDDHVYDYTLYKGIKDGKAVVHRTYGHRGPGGINSYEDTYPFEIAPVSLIDYAYNKGTEKEVWDLIVQVKDMSHISQMAQPFIDHWVKIHGKEAFHDLLNLYLLNPTSNKKWLLEKGADIHVTDSNGENALFYVVRGDDYYLPSPDQDLFLVAKGIDLYHKNNQGQTVLDIIKERSEKDNADRYEKKMALLECEANPNTEIIDEQCLKKCLPNSFRRDPRDNYECVSCDDLSATITTEIECGRCPNRHYLRGDCILNECPDGYFRSGGSHCIPCDSLEAYSSSDCSSRCPNRTQDQRGFCRLKECPDGYFYNDGYLRSQNHFYVSHPACISCDYSEDTYSSECERCSNRVEYKGKCMLKECPNGYFRPPEWVLLSHKSCLPCDFPEFDQQKCPACPDWKEVEGVCVPETCQGNSARDKKGRCYTCEVLEKNISRFKNHISEKECLKCPNLAIKNGCCYSKFGWEYFRDEGLCISCNDKNYIRNSLKGEECLNNPCGDYEFDEDEGVCIPKEPDCHNEKYIRKNFTKKECEKCPGYEYDEEEYMCVRKGKRRIK